MSLIKWEPFNEFDRFFDDRLLPSSSWPSWDLAVDVYEEKGNIVAKMNLPEINKDDLEVSFEENVLTISGKREEEKETDKKDYYSKEISRGSFSRSLRLPKTIEAEKAKAEYKSGMLTVTTPIVEGAKDSVVKVDVIS